MAEAEKELVDGLGRRGLIYTHRPLSQPVLICAQWLRLGFLQRAFGSTSMALRGWLFCIGFAFCLLLVDEVIKFFIRSRRSQGERR